MGLVGEPGIHVLPEGSRKRVGRQYVVFGVTRDRKPDLRPTVDDADHRIPYTAKILVIDSRGSLTNVFVSRAAKKLP